MTDQGRVEPSEDYDEIDILIDTDPIALGERCRRVESRAARAEAALREIKTCVDAQAEDEGLWFLFGRTATEAYLQQGLRALHALVERLVEYEASGEGR